MWLVSSCGADVVDYSPRFMRRSPITAVVPLVTLILVLGAGVGTADASARVAGAPAPRNAARAALDASGDVRVARDISFPQCGAPMPSGRSGSIGVLGTNSGAAFTTNPCLVAELAWAKQLPAAPAFYANTGNPGPVRSTHWPIGQTSPKVCSAADRNSVACSFDYGWNSGRQSFGVATEAAQKLHHVDRESARRRAANVEWWLDAETMNSWLTLDGSPTRAAQQRDTAALLGEYAALLFAGVKQVGIYSTAYQWALITGDTHAGNAQFGAVPQWLAGYESKAAAAAGCADAGFMPGSVHMTQYLAADGFDADVVCTGPDGA
jgi:hypothetical protein